MRVLGREDLFYGREKSYVNYSLWKRELGYDGLRESV